MVEKQHRDQNIVSSCVGQCCLDREDICLGCGRHLEEITGWRAASDQEKMRILQRAKRRLQRLKVEKIQKGRGHVR